MNGGGKFDAAWNGARKFGPIADSLCIIGAVDLAETCGRLRDAVRNVEEPAIQLRIAWRSCSACTVRPASVSAIWPSPSVSPENAVSQALRLLRQPG